MREDPLPADSGPHALTEDAAAHVWFTGMSLVRSQTALGAFYRRLAVRVGQPKAITATARKLAILVHRTLTGTLVYRDPGAHTYNARQRADTPGFTLVNRETGEVLGATVS